MYRLVSSIPLRALVIEQAPALIVSMVIAEQFYKFHSFTLETLTFLPTWYAVDRVISMVRRLLKF